MLRRAAEEMIKKRQSRWVQKMLSNLEGRGVSVSSETQERFRLKKEEKNERWM